jgi:hypothetical protein
VSEHRPGLQLREVEQVFDHPAHTSALVGDRLQQLPVIAVQAGIAQAAGRGGDRHQRRPHVVGDGAQQGGLELVRA